VGYVNVLTVDVSKFLVSLLAVFGVSNVLYGLNKTVLCATANLLSTAFDGKVVEEEEEEEALCAKCAENAAGKTD